MESEILVCLSFPDPGVPDVDADSFLFLEVATSCSTLERWSLTRRSSSLGVPLGVLDLLEDLLLPALTTLLWRSWSTTTVPVLMLPDLVMTVNGRSFALKEEGEGVGYLSLPGKGLL